MIILGILGALVGGFVANIFFGVFVTGFNLPSFIISVGGAPRETGRSRARA